MLSRTSMPAIRPARAFSPLLLALVTLVTLLVPSAAAVPGFVPPPDYVAEPLGLSPDLFAVAPDGRLAAATSSSDGATITLYNHADPRGRRSLMTFTHPDLRFLGGLAFSGPDTLLVSENGAQDTVFELTLSTGRLQPLAPAGSIGNVAQVRVRPTDGAIFAVDANPPGEGALYRVVNGSATPFATHLGTGYLGGLTFDNAGNLYVADTNDPLFLGTPGRILALSPSGAALGTLSLASGQGTGAYDVARDALGALYVTTGATITRSLGGRVYPFGRFTGDYPFPTDLALDPEGGLLVNGLFTGAGGMFRIRAGRGTRMPSPRPSQPRSGASSGTSRPRFR